MSAAVDLPAGRELDIRVGVEVMGWTPVYVGPEHPFGRRLLSGPPEKLDWWDTPQRREPCGWSPSTSIADAWQVVERMTGRIAVEEISGANYLTLVRCGIWDGWAASFNADPPDEWWDHAEAYRYSARGETAPLAICRAALAAMEAADA